jgi:hypothetical protein
MAPGAEARAGGFSPAALLSPGTNGRSFSPRIKADSSDDGVSGLLVQGPEPAVNGGTKPTRLRPDEGAGLPVGLEFGCAQGLAIPRAREADISSWD